MPPAAKVLVEKGKADKDPEVCAKDAPIMSERLVVDAATKGVKNVLVYIPKPTAVNEEAKKAAAGAKVVFDQKKCVFEPHVLGVMTGATVTLKTSDPVNHNINSKLKNNAFNQLLAGGQSTTSSRPTAAERTPGEVTCDIHPWMKAYWLVLDNPYFAVTDEKGNFEIKNVPAGTQKVVVWQEAGQDGFVTAPSGDESSSRRTTPRPRTSRSTPASVRAGVIRVATRSELSTELIDRGPASRRNCAIPRWPPVVSIPP